MRLWKNSLRLLGRLVLLLVVAAATLIIFFPGLLTKYFQLYANYKYLDPLGLRVSYQGFEGDLFGTMKFDQVLVTTADGGFYLAAENVEINIDFLRLIRRDLSLDEVHLERVEVQLPSGEISGHLADMQLPELPWVSIRSLRIDEGWIHQGDVDLWFRISGNLDVTQSVTLKQSRLEMTHPQLPDTVVLQSELLTYDGRSIVVRNGHLAYRSYQAELNGAVQLKPELQLDLAVAMEWVPRLPQQPDWITVQSLHGRLEGPLETLQCDLVLGLLWRDDPLDLAEARFNLIPGGLQLERLHLVHLGQGLTVSGKVYYDGGLTLEADFDRMHLKTLMPELPDLTLDGPVRFSAQRRGNQLDSLDLELALKQLRFRGLRIGAIRGRLHLDDGVLSVVDTVGLHFAGSEMQLWGTVDTKRKLLDLEVYLQTDSLATLLAAAGLPVINGRANGQIWGSGPFTDPSLTGAVMLTGTSYQGLRVGQAFVQFVMDSSLTRPTGRLSISMGDLDLLGNPVEGGEAEFIFAGDTIFTPAFRLYRGFDKLTARGSLIRGEPTQLFLDTLAIIRNAELLATGGLLATWDAGRVELAPQTFQVANGEVSLVGDWLDSRDFSFQISTQRRVDIEGLYRLLGRPPASAGSLDLHASARNRAGDFKLDGSIIARDGNFNRVPFTKFKTEFQVANRRLTFTTLDWQTVEGRATMTGSLSYAANQNHPLGLGKADSLQFSGQVTDFQFHDLQPYLPWTYETRGLVTGELSVHGPVVDPVYEASLIFREPKFDLFTGESLSGQMRYEDQVLAFDDLYLKTPTGEYTGAARLPLDLRPGTPRSQMATDGPIEAALTGHASQLDWLATYFEAIDSLHGDYLLELAVGGTWNQLIRNGRLQVSNGRVELYLMENPIEDLSGDLLLENNRLQVLYLAGRTPREPVGELVGRIRQSVFGRLSGLRGQGDSQLGVTGTVDMTEFFSPRFDLRITGQEVYFATPLKEIEAVGSADFTFTGKDTIDLKGEFIPEPGGLLFRMEFAETESYVLREPDQGPIIRYDIRVPFHTGAYVRNTEVDAEVEGEITLTAMGSEEFHYAGTIDIVSGELMYNGYQFVFDEGTVVFEPSRFNPQFNIRATTEVPVGLEAVDVTLIFSGTLEEPRLNFQYPPTMPYTESDLLSLFTLGDPAIAAGDPARAATLSLGRIMLRESEQYARRLTGLDRFQIQTGGYRSTLGSEGLRINLGKRLSPRWYIGLQADPTLTFEQYDYQVAFRLSSNMFLEGSRSPGQYRINYRLKYRY